MIAVTKTEDLLINIVCDLCNQKMEGEATIEKEVIKISVKCWMCEHNLEQLKKFEDNQA